MRLIKSRIGLQAESEQALLVMAKLDLHVLPNFEASSRVNPWVHAC